MDFYVGEIRLFSYATIPQYWMACNGQQLPVNQYAALYALLGTVYGGTTGQNFNLPNLNGRAILNFNSNAQAGKPYNMGLAGGTETVVLTAAQMPAHNHGLIANNTYDSGGANTHFPGNPNTPTSATQVGINAANANLYATGVTPLVDMADCVDNAGSSAAHENRGPYLVLNYCIAVNGLFPPRP